MYHSMYQLTKNINEHDTLTTALELASLRIALQLPLPVMLLGLAEDGCNRMENAVKDQ